MLIKKLFSFLSLTVLLSLLMPTVVFAATIQANLIQSVTLTANNSGPQTFDPSAGQILKTLVAYNTNNQSTGYVKILKGTTVIKTLSSWTNEGIPASVPDWNGKEIDNSAEAKAVCGEQGAVCPTGDYKVEARIEFVSGNDTFFDLKSADFKVVVTPAVAISDLTVSPTSFNPSSQTADISFTTSAKGVINVEIIDGSTVKDTLIINENLAAGTYNKTNKFDLAWDGKDSQNQLLPNKTYQIKVTAKQTSDGPVLDTKTVDITVNTPASSISITTFNAIPKPEKSGGNFDPSSKGDNQDLSLEFALSQSADSVQIDIKNSKNEVVKTFSASNTTTGTFSWDGIFNNKIVEPGTYSLLLTVSKSGSNNLTSTKNVTVSYGNTGKGEIQDFKVAPDPFDPDLDDAVIQFKNSQLTNIEVEIRNQNGDEIRTFDDYKEDEYSSGSSHSITWNGKNDGGGSVALGTYKVVVITRNNFGVVVAEKSIEVNDSAGSVSSSNDHISNISFKPSSKFEPATDDELEIQYDVKKDLDQLKIFAIRGNEKIELLDDEDVEEENNRELTWDGTDSDDEYVAKGSWKIQFESKIGTTTLLAAKNITVEYEKPEIDDLYVSKSKFDNDLDEFTYIIFRIDSEAKVTIQLLESNQEEDDIVEDMDVEANKWYAVAWDGSNFDSKDDLEFKIIAENSVNEDIFDNEKIDIDLAEDKDFASKANVTNDYISPVLASSNDEMTIYYTLDKDADVKVSIHKGTSTSGSEVIELVDVDGQESGEHSIEWNGRDSNGNKLSSGLYTYKIAAMEGGTDVESGLFVVGTIGDVEGGDGDSGSSSQFSGGKINPNVKVDGGVAQKDDEKPVAGPKPETLDKCAGFKDVLASSKYCKAIEWVKGEGIFKGYDDGTFGSFKPINRAEILKTILEAFDVKIGGKPEDNLGFKDVDVKAWYMPYLKVGKDLGVFIGDGGGKKTARPADTVNRVEAVKMVFETLKVVEGYTITGCSSNYPDVKAGSWYYQYVCEVKKYALFDLIDGMNFGPGELSTRGEMAEVFYRLHLAGVI